MTTKGKRKRRSGRDLLKNSQGRTAHLFLRREGDAERRLLRDSHRKPEKTEKDGKFSFEKHKIHLYKEDFCKFAEGLDEVVGYIREHKPECFNPDGSAISSIPASLDDEFDKL